MKMDLGVSGKQMLQEKHALFIKQFELRLMDILAGLLG